MRVETFVREAEIESEHGRPIPGLVVTCSQCGLQVEVFGTTIASARRGAIMLREQCEESENNFYVIDWDDD